MFKESNKIENRIELHLHTNMSKMDGINSCVDYINKAKEFNMKAIAITDHVSVQAFAESQKYLDKISDNEFKVIYGMEGYYSPSNNVKKNYHISILVKNEVGLKNLYKLISISNLQYFDEKPIIIKNILNENRDGLLLGTACNKGELYQAIIEKKTDEEIEKIIKDYDYLEIQPIINNTKFIRNGKVKDEKELQSINKKIVDLGERLNKLVVATSDTHFLNKEDEICRRILKSNKETYNQLPLYFRTTEEMLKEFEYLGKEKDYEVVVTNTNKIADMCDKIQPISDEKCYPIWKNSDIEIKELAYKGAYKIYGNPLPKEIKSRLDIELESIIHNNFSTIYLIAQKLVSKSNKDGYIVGNRGCIGSSLVAYCLGITETDPIKFNIPFEVFAGLNGNVEPDIDLNFANEYQEKAQKYLETICGEGTTFTAGTVGTLIDKIALEYVKNYFNKNGLEVDNKKIEEIAQKIVGIKRTTGKHPGGIIVVPKGREIYEFTPIQHLADDPNSDIITTHFDYHAIDKNLLKMDILEHNDPTILKKLHNLTGVDPRTIDLEDKETMELFSNAKTSGVSIFDSEYIMKILEETKPTTMEELIKILNLIHGTGLWIDNQQSLVKNNIIKLKDTIASQDDIMNDLMQHEISKEKSFEIMEFVRKGMAIKEKWQEYVQIMKQYNVEDWYIKSCEKIRYLFPKAHATSYVINSFRIGWYKVHYPKEFKEITA